MKVIFSFLLTLLYIAAFSQQVTQKVNFKSMLPVRQVIFSHTEGSITATIPNCKDMTTVNIVCDIKASYFITSLPDSLFNEPTSIEICEAVRQRYNIQVIDRAQKECTKLLK